MPLCRRQFRQTSRNLLLSLISSFNRFTNSFRFSLIFFCIVHDIYKFVIPQVFLVAGKDQESIFLIKKMIQN